MDATNQGVPSAGGQLGGDVHRQAAIKRLKKLEQMQTPKQGGAPRPVQPPQIPKGY